MGRSKLPCWVAAGLSLACTPDEELGPAPIGHDTGVAASAGDDGGDGDGDGDGDTSGTGGNLGDSASTCDPYGDPVEECGNGNECSLGTLECTPSTGSGGSGEACTLIDPVELLDDCLPELVCAFEEDAARCVTPCDPASPECPPEYDCAALVSRGFAACLEHCDLVNQDCPTNEACYPVGMATVPVCLPSQGTGTEGIECEDATDCASGHTCTEAIHHAFGCNDGMPSCCTPLCDELLPCTGSNQTCIALGIADQPDVGFCGP